MTAVLILIVLLFAGVLRPLRGTPVAHEVQQIDAWRRPGPREAGS